MEQSTKPKSGGYSARTALLVTLMAAATRPPPDSPPPYGLPAGTPVYARDAPAWHLTHGRDGDAPAPDKPPPARIGASAPIAVSGKHAPILAERRV